MYSIKQLKNGLRILTVPSQGTQAVTVLVFAGAGSRYETREERGISHFLEHMFFKGGKKYTNTKEVSMAIDGIGGEFNAFTGKEYAGYYVKAAVEHTELACDVLSDMLLHATFPTEEIDKERGVIMEEMKMYEDTPMYQVGWHFENLMYGDNSLGWDTIGTKELIMGVTQDMFKKHQEQLYVTDNTIVVMAGNITEDKAIELGEQYFGKLPKGERQTFEPHDGYGNKQVLLRTKKTEQSHLCIGVPAYPARSKHQFALRLLSVILGGNMSSRMFLNVREAKGLCYYIRTGVDEYKDAGELSTSAGVDKTRLDEAITAIVQQYKLIAAEGITADELKRAKAYVLGHMALEFEDSEELAHFFGRQSLIYDETWSIEQYKEKYSAVTVDEVNALATELFQPENYRMVVIGDESDEERLKGLLYG